LPILGGIMVLAEPALLGNIGKNTNTGKK